MYSHCILILFLENDRNIKTRKWGRVRRNRRKKGGKPWFLENFFSAKTFAETGFCIVWSLPPFESRAATELKSSSPTEDELHELWLQPQLQSEYLSPSVQSCGESRVRCHVSVSVCACACASRNRTFPYVDCSHTLFSFKNDQIFCVYSH